MGTRRRGREMALKILYSMEMNPESRGNVLDGTLGLGNLPDESRVFGKELADDTLNRLETIDKLIGRASLKWDLRRMAAVDRNVLRLAVSELTGEKNTPVRVVIDEAIELAKKFGGEESGTFVNGILVRIRSDLELEP